LAASTGWEWHVPRPTQSLQGAYAWELAYSALQQNAGLSAAGPVYIEPDLIQSWDCQSSPEEGFRLAAGPTADACAFHDQMSSLPSVRERFAWHLDDDFSQLRAARSAIGPPGANPQVRIAHLDTGYDRKHATFPAHVRLDLQRNFMDDQASNDAHDPASAGILKNPGHGTATLALLAGNRCVASQNGYRFDDLVGGAPEAEIVPIRVGTSVAQILTSTIAGGIHYAADLCADQAGAVHVLSMSMGGVASAAWADVVNLAYEAGIILVTAAGNNFSAGFFGFPTHFIVYPARFRRVIAVCGVMADRTPYYGLPFHTMQGNWGPHSKMATALSAHTPNTCWAKLGCDNLVNMDAEGTSAATPQIAAAAALYLQKHAATLLDHAQYPEPWMRVEAVRKALFSSADKSADGGGIEKLGNGILQASRALAQLPAPASSLQKTARDNATFPFLRVLTGIGVRASPQADTMLALEATQLAQQWNRRDSPNPLEDALGDPDLPPEAISAAQIGKFLEGLLNHPNTSKQLKERAHQVRRSLFSSPVPRSKSKAEKTPLASPQPAPVRPSTFSAPVPADAQEGNWLSWHDPKMKWTTTDTAGRKTQIAATDLLNRTVFYKVGHHSSHNATARAKGLELMQQHQELVAFIPVDRAVALKRNPPGSWKMPAAPLYRRLLEKCQGRVVRSDLGWADDAKNAQNKAAEKEFTGLATTTEWTNGSRRKRRRQTSLFRPTMWTTS